MTRREFRDPCHTIRYACSVLWILSLHTGEPECGSTLVVIGNITSKLPYFHQKISLCLWIPIYRTGVCLRHSLASASHSLLYRPRRANTPYPCAENSPALSKVYLASSLRSKQQIDMNTAVGSVGCVTTCRMSPCNDRTRIRRPCRAKGTQGPRIPRLHLLPYVKATFTHTKSKLTVCLWVTVSVRADDRYNVRGCRACAIH